MNRTDTCWRAILCCALTSAPLLGGCCVVGAAAGIAGAGVGAATGLAGTAAGVGIAAAGTVVGTSMQLAGTSIGAAAEVASCGARSAVGVVRGCRCAECDQTDLDTRTATTEGNTPESADGTRI